MCRAFSRATPPRQLLRRLAARMAARRRPTRRRPAESNHSSMSRRSARFSIGSLRPADTSVRSCIVSSIGRHATISSTPRRDRTDSKPSSRNWACRRLDAPPQLRASSTPSNACIRIHADVGCSVWNADVTRIAVGAGAHGHRTWPTRARCDRSNLRRCSGHTLDRRLQDQHARRRRTRGVPRGGGHSLHPAVGALCST